MLKLPEAVAMMDPAPGYSKQRPERRSSSTPGCDDGYHISYPLATLLIILFCSGLLLTGFLVYLLRPCGSGEQLPVLRPGETPQSLELEGVSGGEWPGRTSTTPSTTTGTRSSTTTTSKVEDNTSKEEEKWPPIRLPTSIVPDHYFLEMIPFMDPGNWTFHGSVRIRMNVSEMTPNVTLNVKSLEIDPSKIRLKSFEKATRHRRLADPQVKKMNLYPSKELMILELTEDLLPGHQYQLEIPFKGIIREDLKGFYRSSYTAGNETRWLVVTQFQATAARFAFPCFDEPSFKAKFELRLARPKNMTALSNMPKSGTPQPVDGVSDYEWDTFQETVPMSTYLLAFAVTDFKSKSKDKVKIWARPEAINQTEYALEVAVQVLDFFERYFGIPYPLPKMDIIALPDFEVGAMENWGFITAREATALVEKGVSAPESIKVVATVIAHELAHQWFGNLVTPRWWSDIWLNEGFASYMESVAMTEVEPLINHQSSVFDNLHGTLAVDHGSSSHPISQEVTDPMQIDDMFDDISYLKGAAIIRMMDHFLTHEVFQDGLNSYIKKEAYSSAVQDDLWESLTEAARKKGRMLEGGKPSSVKEVMDTWTLQAGFPVLTVIRNYENQSANLSQMPLILGNSPKDIDSKKRLWYIPVSYTTQAQPDLLATRPSFWMTNEIMTIEDVGASERHWLLFNLQQTGYYRVNYDKNNWKMLISHLQDPRKFKQFDVVTRAQLIDDSFFLARAGLLDYEVPLELSRYLRMERELLPWMSSSNPFSYIMRMARTTGKYDRFRQFMVGLIEPTYGHLGFYSKSKERRDDLELRNLILNLACTWEHESCLRESVILFQKWRSDPNPDKYNPIPTNLKSLVYCTAIKLGGEGEWDFAWERYLRSNVATERGELLYAMGCSRQPWILRRYMEWALDPESGIRRQDMTSVFSAVCDSDVGRMIAYNFIADEWEKLNQNFDDQQTISSALMMNTISSMNTRYQLEMMKDFISKRNDTRNMETLFVDLILPNIEWMDRYFHIIDAWLKNTLQNGEK